MKVFFCLFILAILSPPILGSDVVNTTQSSSTQSSIQNSTSTPTSTPVPTPSDTTLETTSTSTTSKTNSVPTTPTSQFTHLYIHHKSMIAGLILGIVLSVFFAFHCFVCYILVKRPEDRFYQKFSDPSSVVIIPPKKNPFKFLKPNFVRVTDQEMEEGLMRFDS